ncbi:hypothetical protein [Sutterella wadsworthensis]|uniref:hypothetical protein n=1 Tax=Sutterella wadsworthensis TaxID=40545 RepID=UPI000DFFD37A|nr:hypothetical protein [Sutterella wadsworthensis]QQS89206.1 hypothetical protein I6J16_08635 [Sutterella wadsworthensis]RBP52339.1 hypothetical protein DES29_11913 [Sutterella wadsworthensis]
MAEEKTLEERLAALEKKVEELEKKLEDRPTKSEVSQEINYRTKNFAVRTAAGRIH